ncbi:MAG: hypothetical protein RL410_193 [Actinomycetota bacterium]
MAQVNTERLQQAIEPLVAASNLVLEEIKVRSAGRRQLVQVVVDSDSTVDLDEVASVSRAIDHAIEDHNLLGDIAFTLEVTTPGIDRPLTQPRHWRKNIGRLVEVNARSGEKFVARLVSFEDGFIAFEGKDRFSIDAIESGIVQIEFNRKSKDSDVDAAEAGDNE